MSAKIYIVDDDIGIRTILANIVEDNDLGVVIGESDDGFKALNDINSLKPDLVFIDLLLPTIDGIEIIKRARNNGSNSNFIMISQVSSSDMVSEAYQNGIDFYVNKPLNVIEVVSITKKALEIKKYKKVLAEIGNQIFNASNSDNIQIEKEYCIKDDVLSVFNELGIMGESGCNDLLSIIEIIVGDRNNNGMALYKYSMKDLYERLSKKLGKDDASTSNTIKAIEQRIRRTIQNALENVANMGIEDFGGYKFEKYSTSVFDFKEVKNEMDYIRGKNATRGKINVKAFLEGVINLLKI